MNSIQISNGVKVKFYGKGGELFGVMFTNILLTMVTFGIYAPWARAALMRYTYQSTEFAGHRFAFHGTGGEMFRGMLKASFILFGLAVLVGLVTYSLGELAGMIVQYVGIILLTPYAIHGRLRYRMSRTSWRGIHFGYRGDLSELRSFLLKDMALTILSLGFYAPWMIANLNNYAISRIRMGNVTFNYSGSGGELFKIWIKGYILTFITLGIYAPWFIKDLYNYHINNLSIDQGEKIIRLQSNASGGDIFSLYFVNMLLVVFTLGIGFPWAIVRESQYFASIIGFEEGFDANLVEQTEDEYLDATGEGLAEML